MNVIETLKNIKNRILKTRVPGGSFDTLPPERLKQACGNPFLRDMFVQFSLDEYDQNPYYVNVVDSLVNFRVGPCPNVMAQSTRLSDDENNFIDDEYLTWAQDNGIGKMYRELVKQGILTGLSLAVPIKKQYSLNPVKTAFKVYGFNCFQNPKGAGYNDKLINGIEYNEDWEPEKFYIRDEDADEPKSYHVNEVLYWGKNYKNGILWPIPECYAAFQYYPFIRRFIEAVLKAEEFNASFPMAVELDPTVYSAYAQEVRDAMPRGTFEYQPGMVPTLKPGMKLTGIPSTQKASERSALMEAFAGMAALSVQMPRNLALGFSGNSNMSSAQMDVQPWANKIYCDRFDFEPILRRGFKFWWDIAVRRVMPYNIRRAHLTMVPHSYGYSEVFEHFDPKKRADARAIDLAAGTETLTRIYSKRGLKFKREIEREAKSLGIPTDELISLILLSRNNSALAVLDGEPNESD